MIPPAEAFATSLNELARDCGLGIVLMEEMIPVRDAVRGACELFGIGSAAHRRIRRSVPRRGGAEEYADAALNALSLAPGGQDAQVIGDSEGFVAGKKKYTPSNLLGLERGV